MNVIDIVFSQSHLTAPFTMNDKSGQLTTVEKVISVALSILIGAFTLGIGGVIAFYSITAAIKAKKLNDLPIPEIFQSVPESQDEAPQIFTRTPIGDLSSTPSRQESVNETSEDEPTNPSQISPVTEENQQCIIDHNQGLRRNEHIPIVPRNQATGWPLLQISLFVPAEPYENVLGGGRCHYLDIPQYFLARLLQQVNQIKVRSENLDQVIPRIGFVDLNFDCSPYIKITSKSGPYGTENHMYVNDMNNPNVALESKLSNIQSQATEGVAYFGEYRDRKKYTKAELEKSIKDTKLAIFHNGQMYVDLGELLKDNEQGASALGEDLKDEFRNLFKVDEFLEVMDAKVRGVRI